MVTVKMDYGNTISFADSQALKTVGQPVNPFRKLAIGKGLFSVNNRFLVRVQF